MSILNFSKANCKNCYKCLRSCPVKAIRFNNNQAEIVEDRCIGCGTCLVVCPQGARNVKSDMEKLKDAIKSGKKVCASIAPSYIANFNYIEDKKFPSLLRKLGINYIEETAVGADIVSNLYNEYIKKTKKENYITTACPSVNYLIQKYYPELIKYMIPTVSPMIAHGKVMKKVYGNDAFVVFIGPCPAKKLEAENFQTEGIVDAVITFEELKEWIEESEIDIKNLELGRFDNTGKGGGRLFPVGGGIIDGIDDESKNKKYEIIAVDGIERCMDLFKSLNENKLQNTIIEADTCRGGCIGGPCTIEKGNIFGKRKIIKDKLNINENIKDIDVTGINFDKVYFDRSLNIEKASDKQIKDIMKTMGKYEKNDELNCGVCGYNTCAEKAEAIYENMAEVEMCLHYMRNKAESLSNLILQYSPNAIIIVDEDMFVKEINPAAEKLFKTQKGYILDKPLSVLINDEDFYSVKESKDLIFGKRVYYPEYDAAVIQNIVYLSKEKLMISIMVDVTNETKEKQEQKKIKEQTIETAQKVIKRQMNVAQEIASLLGETTAETKVILNRLMEVAKKEDDNI